MPTTLSLGAMMKSTLSAEASISQSVEEKPAPGVMERVRVFSSSAVVSSLMRRVSIRCMPLVNVEYAGSTNDAPEKEVSSPPATTETSNAIASAPFAASKLPFGSFKTAFNIISSPSSAGTLVAANPMVFLPADRGGTSVIVRVCMLLDESTPQPGGKPSSVRAKVTVPLSSILASSGIVNCQLRLVCDSVTAWLGETIADESASIALIVTGNPSRMEPAWVTSKGISTLSPSAAVDSAVRNPMLDAGAGSSLSMMRTVQAPLPPTE